MTRKYGLPMKHFNIFYIVIATKFCIVEVQCNDTIFFVNCVLYLCFQFLFFFIPRPIDYAELAIQGSQEGYAR